MFTTFLEQGFFHILDPGGMDHLLFFLALCAIYRVEDWKQILWMVSSFTLAHSLSLLLSAMGVLSVSTSLVEWLIPLTIAFTCIENLFIPGLHPYRVFFSGFFGLIHGLGFSNQLKLLFSGMHWNLFETLLPFNIGLELGQLLIISGILILFYLVRFWSYMSPRRLNYMCSVPVLLQALYWLYERNIFGS